MHFEYSDPQTEIESFLEDFFISVPSGVSRRAMMKNSLSFLSALRLRQEPWSTLTLEAVMLKQRWLSADRYAKHGSQLPLGHMC